MKNENKNNNNKIKQNNTQKYLIFRQYNVFTVGHSVQIRLALIIHCVLWDRSYRNLKQNKKTQVI